MNFLKKVHNLIENTWKKIQLEIQYYVEVMAYLVLMIFFSEKHCLSTKGEETHNHLVHYVDETNFWAMMCFQWMN